MMLRGITYYFVMQSASVCSFMIESESCSVLSNSLPTTWTAASRLLCPWNSGKNTGAESCSLLQGIFPTQRSTVAFQTPLSMEFFRQEYWNGLPCPPSGDLPHPGTEPESLTSNLLLSLVPPSKLTFHSA